MPDPNIKYDRQGYTFDVELLLADLGSVLSANGTTIGQVGGSDGIVDVGPAQFLGTLVVDITAAPAIDGNDEAYQFILRGSTSPTFASTIVELQSFQLGALEIVGGDIDLDEAGRYGRPCTNVFGSVAYRYLQIQSVIVGATVSLTWGAWLARSVL